jgi:hypothetical protein
MGHEVGCSYFFRGFIFDFARNKYFMKEKYFGFQPHCSYLKI